jgi:hypothetical protein
LNPTSKVDGLRLLVSSNGTFSGTTSASIDGYSASVSIEASPSTLDLSLTTSNSFSALGLLKSSLSSLGLSVSVPASGPSATAELVVRNNTVRSLSVAFTGTVSVQQISQCLGFTWPFSSDVLAVTQPSVVYAATSGSQAMRLAIAAHVAIPVLSFNGGGALLIHGKDSVQFAVSTCGSHSTLLSWFGELTWLRGLGLCRAVRCRVVRRRAVLCFNTRFGVH